MFEMNHKVSVTDVAATLVKRSGDEANAVIVIAIGDDSSSIDLAGFDPLFIDESSIKAVSAMTSLLDSNFNITREIFEHMKRNGRFSSEMTEERVAINRETGEERPFNLSDALFGEKPEGRAEAAKEPEEKARRSEDDPMLNLMKGLLCGMSDMIKHVEGGAQNADDD